MFLQYYEDYRRTCTVRALESQICAARCERVQSNGERRLVQFMTIMASGFQWRPHIFQQSFQREVTKAVAPLLVGDDWASNGARIMRERSWTHMTRMVMAKAPRRFGKSVAVAMVVIAIAETLPNSVQSIFSTGRRASRNLLEICHKMALERGLRDQIICYNQEQLFIKNANGEISRIFSYPANAKVMLLLLLFITNVFSTLIVSFSFFDYFSLCLFSHCFFAFFVTIFFTLFIFVYTCVWIE